MEEFDNITHLTELIPTFDKIKKATSLEIRLSSGKVLPGHMFKDFMSDASSGSGIRNKKMIVMAIKSLEKYGDVEEAFQSLVSLRNYDVEDDSVTNAWQILFSKDQELARYKFDQIISSLSEE